MDMSILGLLLLMSFIMLWMVIERVLFYRNLPIEQYPSIHELEIDLTKNLTTISIIGTNAPYLGLLGTVVGILLTFFVIGREGGNFDTAEIMMSLSLALKTTAAGILVAIPSMMFYNVLYRQVEVKKMQRYAVQDRKRADG